MLILIGKPWEMQYFQLPMKIQIIAQSVFLQHLMKGQKLLRGDILTGDCGGPKGPKQNHKVKTRTNYNTLSQITKHFHKFTKNPDFQNLSL